MHFWEGLKHRPYLTTQSGGFPRSLRIGHLLRDDDAVARNLRRALSQSVFYLASELGAAAAATPDRSAALESIRQMLTRSELCPPHPAVEAAVFDTWSAGIRDELSGDATGSIVHDLSSIDHATLRSLLIGWAVSQIPAGCEAPIAEFDDESASGARQERSRWRWLQDAHGGRARRWSHPQVLFQTLLDDAAERDERRADFLICPPWTDAVALEVHGRFDKIDQAKDSHLRSRGLLTFNDIVGATDDEERDAMLAAVLDPPPGCIVSPSFNHLLDACWVASQVDLSLLVLLSSGAWSPAHPVVSLIVPPEHRTVAAEAAAQFIRLARSCDGIWGLRDEALLHDRMTVEMGTGPSLSVSIDPEASTYIAAGETLDSTITVRRCSLPADLESLAATRFPLARDRRPTAAPAPEAVLPAVERCFGLRSLKPGQHRGIVRALEGTDSLVLLPTGHGKSLIFQIAGLLLPGVTIVVEAWRALIDDQVRNLQDRGIGRVAAVHKDRQLDPVRGARELCAATIIYVAPERLYIDSFQPPLEAVLQQRGCDLLVIDEAHAVSEAGHSFRPSYLGLVDRMTSICRTAAAPRPPILALTATAADIVVRDISGILGISEPPISLVEEAAGPAFVRSNLTDDIILVPAADGGSAVEMAFERALVNPAIQGKGIVFCVSKGDWTKSTPRWYGVLGTRRRLEAAGRRVASYVGGDDMTPAERREQTDRFTSGAADVMVATDAFGAGIDLRDVRWTIHLGMPSGIEAYCQQSGRAGRDGSPAHGVLIVDEDSESIWKELVAAKGKPDSFDALREVVGNKTESGRGSVARQISFMLGQQAFDRAAARDITQPPGTWLPAFPGWRFEADLCDRPLIRSLVDAGSHREFEFHFDSAYDALAWKAVHRLRSLNLVRGSYRRTFLKKGLNKFVPCSTDLAVDGGAEALARQIETCVGRLRGKGVGRDIGSRARETLERKETTEDRIAFACAVILVNTYEAVRSSRLGSLDGLRLYARTSVLEKRRQLLEDYFASDAFTKAIHGLSESAATIENWKKALDLARDETHWRTGVFQRMAESLPGLPHFLLLASLLHSDRADECKQPMHELFDSDTVPPATREWAWKTLSTSCGEQVRERLFKVTTSILQDALDGPPADGWVATRLPRWLDQSDGTSALGHAVVSNWIQGSLRRSHAN